MVARCKEDILKAKGVKPTLSPNLNTLATVEALDVKKLLFIGVGCQVRYHRNLSFQVSQLMPHLLKQQLLIALEACLADMLHLPVVYQRFARDCLRHHCQRIATAGLT